MSLTTACAQAPQREATQRPVDLSAVPPGMDVALFAGGCFWCMEAPFDALDGVVSTISGYTDGFVHNPKYRDVANGLTGHTEVIQIIFDPKVISYAKLLEVFWVNIDPAAKDRQFCDRGTQYRSGIYTYNAQQLKAAQASIASMKKTYNYAGPIHTEIKPATRFYRAEEYHQDFYKKNPSHYKRYRLGCGRDARLRALWGRQSSSESTK